MLEDISSQSQLRALAARKAKPDEFKSVRNSHLERELAEGWTIVRRGKIVTRLRRPKSKDQFLEDRIWTLLYRMQFSHLSGYGEGENIRGEDPHGPDRIGTV